MLLVAAWELHCKDGAEWHFEKACVSDGRLIESREDSREHCKDQGHMLDDNDEPDDDLHELDESETSDHDDNAEKNDDEDSDCEVWTDKPQSNA